MSIRQACRLPSRTSTLYEALLNEKWLIHLLDRARVLAHGCGYGAQSDGTSVKLVDDGLQQLVIRMIQTMLIYV